MSEKRTNKGANETLDVVECASKERNALNIRHKIESAHLSTSICNAPNTRARKSRLLP